MPDRVLRVQELAFQIAPVRQEQPQPVAGFGLDVSLPVPAGAHDVRNPERVCLVGLVALRFQRGAHVVGFQTDRRQAKVQQFRMQPGRQRPRLMAGPPQPAMIRLERDFVVAATKYSSTLSRC